MAANQITLRLTGSVSYDDQTSGYVGLDLDKDGNIVADDTTANVKAMKFTHVDFRTGIIQLWTGLGAVASLAPTPSKTGLGSDTVTSYSLSFSGIVSYDDGSVGEFGSSIDSDGIAIILTGSETVFDAVLAVAALRAQVNAFFSAAFGVTVGIS